MEDRGGGPPPPGQCPVGVDDLTGQAIRQCRDGVRAADAGRWEEAEFRWQKALAIESQTACAHNNLGVLAERDGDFEEAGEAYARALEAASGAARERIQENLDAFQEARTADEVPTTESSPEAERVAELEGVSVLRITLSVPEAEGRDLANYERILVGGFVNDTPDAPIPVSQAAVSYLRRRIVQRTFFQTVDMPGELLDASDDPLSNPDMWVERAAEVEADLVLTGRVALTTDNASRVVTENIRTADGEVREVARFREMTSYRVELDYLLLRGEDGSTLLEGELEASREFAADDGLTPDEAFIETMEELLPQFLDVITPQRTEQTRVLIY